MGRTPVPQAAWDAGQAPPDRRPLRDPEAPISGVTWGGARAWLAKNRLRLPSDAEWERACRGGGAGAYWWGEAMDPSRCWHLTNGEGRPRPPALHADQVEAHPYGLVDMAGNVREWCADDLDLPMEGSSWQEGNPGKVLRGGSFDTPSLQCRSGHRDGTDPRAAYPDLGFRAAASLPK
jgi:formylglycine-generating enzyme required for sulfatase activity